jgi:hypothetical protein
MKFWTISNIAYGKILEKWRDKGWQCIQNGSDCGSFRVLKTVKETADNIIRNGIEFDVVTGWFTCYEFSLTGTTPMTINKRVKKMIDWTLEVIEEDKKKQFKE